MTEAPKRTVYSQDYWDIVLSQLRKRPAVLISLTVLVVFYAAAIYAPILANDRPLYFKGIDLSLHRKAQRELGVTTRAALELITAGSAGPEVSAREAKAVAERVAVLRTQLAKEDQTILDEVDGVLEELEGSPSPATARRLVDLADRVKVRLNPAAPGTPPLPGQSVALVSYTAYPVLQNLSRGEIFFMTLWAVVLTWPVWNRIVNRALLKGDRARIRRARRAKTFAFLAPALLAGLLWQGKQGAFFLSPYKAGLSRGDIIAEKVVFPPIPFGIAEINDTESFRPPTWHLESVITEEGFYLHGPRAGTADEATGIPKMAKPVEVRRGEPAVNDNHRHPLGTDSLGRDMLARIVWGARVSLAVGLVSTLLLALVGTILGSLAGYYGGKLDLVISRIIEVFQCFPVFFLILIVVAFIGPSILNIMLAIGLFRWTGVARLVRGEFIRLRGQDFVVASRALGVRNVRTIFRHVLPNGLGPVLVAATFSVASGILIESGLSFLGFGIQLPIPSWGALLIESRSAEHWWIQIYPGVLIFITVLFYNLLGESVRDALDPRLKAA
jgi:peptide/nickel transport system permease protein